MGVTEQTLEHLKMLRAGGTLQRHVGTDDIFLKSNNATIPLRPAQLKRLTAQGLVERSGLETIEEFQLAPSGHRAIAEHDGGEEDAGIIMDAAGLLLVTTGRIRDEQGGDIPYFLITDLDELTPRHLLEISKQAASLFAMGAQVHAVQLTPGDGAVTPISAELPAPHFFLGREELPTSEYQELLGGAIFITPDGFELIGVLEGGRQVHAELSLEQLQEALANAH